MSSSGKRKIIVIDREKCDGCGLCAQACHEGAIQIVQGKAELVSDSYCDGLGDCVGECPQGAISFEEREAAPYDAEAVRKHLQTGQTGQTAQVCGCPGSAPRSLRESGGRECCAVDATPSVGSRLANWPVQIRLVPVNAPYLMNAHLAVAADCTAFAHPSFQQTFLNAQDTICLIGCPKLDDAQGYQEKMRQILERNAPVSVTVIRMEVPCCGGLTRLVKAAMEQAGRPTRFGEVTIGVNGEILGREATRFVFGE